ncbi:MAG: nicotinate phosphoribosyltransferase [Oscillospiraceae bacterium]|nr:nicotinate phosphoribosyltransferase [Oscillospiraceae bacterium]MBO5917575.1 nicotinate phosphoribosyltransferase [Oscillospiraceae bacterium]
MKVKTNLTMLCDFYQLTMSNGYFRADLAERICYFDLFYRSVPDKGGFAIAAGLAQVVEYIQSLRFDEEDIAYLRSKGCFDEGFLDYLRNFKFTGDIWAVPEGTPVFPNEPIITVRAPAIQAQFIETFLLLTMNHQCLIATKSNRIVRAAEGRPVAEFGSRRAQGADGAILGARASYIAGCAATACTMADQWFGSPATGTMAHSWVQMFPDEYTAFKTYCQLYPNNATLLVDTYNVLKSGVPNAIRVFKEELLPKGITKCAIRLDSGDLTYLSRKARQMLDEAGLTDCKILASNALDEYIIRDLVRQGARIDSFGVGERLITSRSEPVFGGVYKLAAIEDADGTIIPKIKISENPAKITTPHFKKVYRIFSKDSGKAEADLICLHDEQIDFTQPLELFDPDATWKRKTFTDYEAQELLVPVFQKGKLVYDLPDLQASRAHCQRQVDALWDEVKRFENPHNYYVDLSQKLWDIKHALLNRNGN